MNQPSKAQLRKDLSRANETLADIHPLFEAFNDATEEAERLFDHMPITFTEWLESYVNQHEAMKREIKRLERQVTFMKTDLRDLAMLEGTTDTGESAQRREILSKYE